MNSLMSLHKRWSNLKLRTKIIITFLLVVLSVVLVLTTIIGFSTKVFFVKYVSNHSDMIASQWSENLGAYYTQNNKSWNGAERLFLDTPSFRMRGMNRGMMPVDRIVVVDENDKVVADSDSNETIGKTPPELEYQAEEEIIVNNKGVGKVILGVSPPPGMATLEQSFFSSVISATIVASIIAVLLAIVLALQFSRRISIPLVYLTEAAKKLAEKDYKHRLRITAQDEIGTLAGAFNTMADAIEKNEQIRSHLVADVAHELRTPITIIRGNLESLQAGVLEPTQEVIVSIHDEILRLSRLINDLQEITLAESGNLILNYTKVNAVDLLTRVVNNFKGSASVKNIEMNLTVPKQEYLIEIDEDKIIQVLSNIINNAIRHTPVGKKINVSLAGSDEIVNLSVADEGPGINSEDLPFIFDRFYRGSKSRNRSDGGAGLGLAIAKSLVEAHGGKIEVRCIPGGGSIFTITLSKAKNCLK